MNKYDELRQAAEDWLDRLNGYEPAIRIIRALLDENEALRAALDKILTQDCGCPACPGWRVADAALEALGDAS